LGLDAKSSPKHFQKKLTSLGPAEPDPKHFKKGLGLAMPHPRILLYIL